MAMQGGQTEVGESQLSVQLGKSRAFSNVPWALPWIFLGLCGFALSSHYGICGLVDALKLVISNPVIG